MENYVKKIFHSTIKPPKRPEEEIKREPTPELARISALVTRPPKQKSSKRADEGLLETSYTFPLEASFSNANHDTIPRVKKTIFKTLPLREPSPINHKSYNESFDNSYDTQKNTQFCFTVSMITSILKMRVCYGTKIRV